MKDSKKYYSVGALLYSPANSVTFVDSLVEEKFDQPFSLALCLEDTIRDDCVEEAERQMALSLQRLLSATKEKTFFLPQIFIRVRSPQQISRIYDLLGTSMQLITGFILPKFALDNADNYIEEMRHVNTRSDRTLYMMPIFESATMIDLRSRGTLLYTLKSKLDAVEPWVLNIRVGGNDLCHNFGFRRHNTETIYDITTIANILADIMTVFGLTYVVSGPVWEYYHGSGWDSGLRRELQRDILNGFVGKTVIHPNQISIVNEALKISQTDYEDALSILNWKDDIHNLVSGSVAKERMNECKTHSNWALRTLMLAETYGVAKE